ncbi:MAG: PEP-CTERM sorting domain-containing protein [Pseudomonadota bacterium]
MKRRLIFALISLSVAASTVVGLRFQSGFFSPADGVDGGAPTAGSVDPLANPDNLRVSHKKTDVSVTSTTAKHSEVSGAYELFALDNFRVTSVSEPATLLLLGLGLVGAGLRRRS